MNTFTKKHALALLGGLLALLSSVPLTERAYAHLTSWGFGLPGYGLQLIHTALVVMGVTAVAIAYRRRTS